MKILFGIFCSVLFLSSFSFAQTKYDAIRMGIRKAIQENPANAVGIDLGISDSGLPVEGVAIGSGPVHELVVATHHGNEYGSTFVAMAVLQSLAKNPIPGRTVYVVPVLNIDGYNRGSRYEAFKGPASNGLQDPNRDYPGPCGSENGGPFLLKSTKSLADFIDRAQIVTSLTLHTYWPAVAYPWGVGQNFTEPYLDIYRKLAGWTVQESQYAIGNSAELLYPANGCFEDYAFWKHGIWSLLMELGRSHSPSQSDMDEMARVNVPGIRRVLELAPVQRAALVPFDGKCYRGPNRRWE